MMRRHRIAVWLGTSGVIAACGTEPSPAPGDAAPSLRRPCTATKRAEAGRSASRSATRCSGHDAHRERRGALRSVGRMVWRRAALFRPEQARGPLSPWHGRRGLGARGARDPTGRHRRRSTSRQLVTLCRADVPQRQTTSSTSVDRLRWPRGEDPLAPRTRTTPRTCCVHHHRRARVELAGGGCAKPRTPRVDARRDGRAGTDQPVTRWRSTRKIVMEPPMTIPRVSRPGVLKMWCPEERGSQTSCGEVRVFWVGVGRVG